MFIMSTWIRLALKEFFLPFHYRKTGCPGGRDFVWLTIFMTLLLTLMLLLLASREGLLNRFVDVLLGNIPGYGVPIAVTNNMLSRSGIDAINTEVLEDIEALSDEIPGLRVSPYRTLEEDFYPFVKLPDEKIWANSREDGTEFGPDFDGWAVYTDDPLWTGTPTSADVPLEMILSKRLFARYFKYQRYRDVLSAMLPETLLRDIPEHLDMNAERLPDTLWMQVKNQDQWELLPFRISWVERFPVIDPIAFLFPLSTYHAIKTAHDHPELDYFPEGEGRRTTRIAQFSLEVNQEQDNERIAQFYETFSARFPQSEMLDFRGDMLITLKRPLPAFWIEGYTQQYDLRFRIMNEPYGHAIGHEKGMLQLPCGSLQDKELDERQFTACSGDRLQPVSLDVTAKGRGYHHALVYVPDRMFLSPAKDALVSVKEEALSIHPSYQDALNRFGFLSEMLETLEKPYTWFLFIFLVALLGIQIGTLLGHHRHRYGIFLAKGMEWWEIYAMLWLQILLALLIGMCVAVFAISATSALVQTAIQTVAQKYSDTLSISDLNLLPLSGGDYVFAALVVLCIALILATLLLYFMPLRQRTQPARLL